MAKKKTVSGKKTTASKKTTAKKTTVKKTASKKKTASINTTDIAPIDNADIETHQQNIALLPPNLMSDTMESVTSCMNDFIDIANNNLTALQRRRKRGPGVRNYGFIDKVSDLAEANPQFAQFFKISNLKNSIRNIEMCRDLVVLLQSFSRAVSNTMLVYSDEAFRMALIYYNMVREMSRRGDPTAMELFRTLQPFFRRTRRTTAEPTQKELERDLHALIHGKKDGKIIVENITPKSTAGKRVIVDDVHKSKAKLKETSEMQEED